MPKLNPRTASNFLNDPTSFHSNSLNPLLAFQPAYTYSMPTQLLIYGIVLTLLTVLILHLAFTAKYHYPLARTNFILLLSAVCLTEISVIVVVVVTNEYLFSRSRSWPFMFDYVEVPMPPSDWKTVQLIGWYLMQGAVTFFAHATHIQFLTLLFPSSLEQKLIIAFLGPLCLFSSSLFFTYFLNDPNLQDLGDAIRNTATSTLSLLYTFGLIIWGFAINRKRAWETEGGTFGFGVLATSLALGGTAANFIEVKEDRLKWLPWLVNTVLLWQSWTGFWWWVGAGMWSGEVEEIEKREEEKKKKRREEKRQRKRAKILNQLIILDSPSKSNSRASLTADNDATQDSCNNNNSNNHSLVHQSSNIGLGSVLSSGASNLSRRLRGGRRRATNASSEPNSPNDRNHIELDVLERAHGQPNNSSLVRSDNLNRQIATSDLPHRPQTPVDPTEGSSSTNDTSQPSGLLSFIRKPACVERWMGALTEAHNAAAKEQARTADGIKETQQVKKWGIGPMTQRAALGKVARRVDDRLKRSTGRSDSNSESSKTRRKRTRIKSRLARDNQEQSFGNLNGLDLRIVDGGSGGGGRGVGEANEWTSDEGGGNQRRIAESSNSYGQAGGSSGRRRRRREEEQEGRSDYSDRLEELRSNQNRAGSSELRLIPRSRDNRNDSQTNNNNNNHNTDSESSNQINSYGGGNGSNSNNNDDCESNSRGMRSGHSWAWKGPLIKARLKDVTSYD